MYSQAWSPTPSTTASAPELRAQNRSPDPAAQVHLARGGAVEQGIARDDVVLGQEQHIVGRLDDDAAARKSLADIVVGVADQFERDTRRQERADRLPGGAGERDVDGVVGQTLGAVAPGDLGAEQGADGAVDVAHRQLQPHRVRVLERALGELDERRSRAWSRPWSWSRTPPALRQLARHGRPSGTAKIGVRSSPLLFQCATPGVGVEHLGVADRLVDAAEPELGQVLRMSSAMNRKKFSTNSGLPLNRARSSGFWVATPDRAGVEVADPHHDAARHHQRRGGEAELLGAEQRGDDHVAGGAHAAVALHGDAVAQPVEHQRLLGVGQADLPGRAGVFEATSAAPRRCRRRSRRSARRRRAPWTPPPRRCRRRRELTSLTWMRASELAFFRSWISCARSSIE